MPSSKNSPPPPISRTNTDDLDGTVFISDNLPFLQRLDGESVDLVCIDPPFSKTQTFEGQINPPLSADERDTEINLLERWDIYDANDAYSNGLEWPDQTGTTASFRDIWSFDKHIYEEAWERIRGQNAGVYHLINTTRYTHGDSMAAYLAFMAQRLLEVRRVLRPTGSVYLHCDYTANGYLRLLMDAVFGQKNFRNEIVWRSARAAGRGSKHKRKRWTNIVNFLLFYSKSDAARVKPYRPLTEEEAAAKFNKVAEIDGQKLRYADDSKHLYRSPNKGAQPNLCYEWRGFTNLTPSGWPMTRENMEEEYQKGNIVIRKDGKLERRLYERDYKGLPVGTLWADIEPVESPERTGYPTQKPQAIARRIIEASTEPGDIVVDCFAGCAYVPVAAELTGRRWVACDMSPRAWTVIRRQFHKQPDLRIRTEGELAAHPGDEEAHVEVAIGEGDRLIRIRGPHDLPIRSEYEIESASRRRSNRKLAKVTYRIKPVETDLQIWCAFVTNWGPTCWYCMKEKQKSRRELHLDHIEPNRRNGSNDDRGNRALACAICNGNKGNRLTPEETIEEALRQGLLVSSDARDLAIETFFKLHNWAKKTQPPRKRN